MPRQTGRALAEVTEGGRETSVTVQLASGALRGRVVDAAGAPLARVGVSTRKLADGPEEENLPYSAETDDRGNFVLADRPAGRHAVAVTLDGALISPVCSTEVPAGGESALLEVRVTRESGTLISVARSADGRGLPEALCEVIVPEIGTVHQHRQKRDAEGRITIPDLPPGSYEVLVGGKGLRIVRHAVTVRAGETVRLEDMLEAGGGFEWSIRDGEGRPVAGAVCRLLPNDPERRGESASGVTSADGTWIREGLRPGRYTLITESPGRGEVSATVEIEAGDRAVLTTRMTGR